MHTHCSKSSKLSSSPFYGYHCDLYIVFNCLCVQFGVDLVMSRIYRFSCSATL